MKQCKYFSLIALALVVLPLQAQETMLNKAKAHLNATKGLQIDYQLTIGDDSSTGSYYALGKAFYLESQELKAWHQDGNLWVYIAQNREVNLSHPVQEDLQELNPLLNLERISSKTFTLIQSQSGALTTIKAVPKTPKGEEIEWLTLVVHKDGEPQTLTLKQRGMTFPVHLKVTKFVKGTTDAMKRKGFFSYDANKLPGVSVIDLR